MNRSTPQVSVPISKGEKRMSDRTGSLRTLDGVIMLSPDGCPAGGSFPDNVWIVMGRDGDSIEDFFGPSADVLTADLERDKEDEQTRYCVGFDTARQKMVMNGDGAYPVYVSGLLRMHGSGID